MEKTFRSHFCHILVETEGGVINWPLIWETGDPEIRNHQSDLMLEVEWSTDLSHLARRLTNDTKAIPSDTFPFQTEGSQSDPILRLDKRVVGRIPCEMLTDIWKIWSYSSRRLSVILSHLIFPKRFRLRSEAVAESSVSFVWLSPGDQPLVDDNPLHPRLGLSRCPPFLGQGL